MCGKFTAMASWREVVKFSQPLTVKPGDEVKGYGVMQPLPVIVWDREVQKRVIVPMRWGFRAHHGTD
jgi:putative SOS response-associated peptidase YedK